MIQVLYESVWIDESGISKYMMRMVDEDGELIPQPQLIHMMETSPYFANEVSQLEYFCQELGTRALINTKFHAYYSSKGIEYYWGHSRYFYCKYPIFYKKVK